MVSGSCTGRQITGTSDIFVDDAIARALSVAGQSFREPDWFDVLTARGFISNGQVTHSQVPLDLGYSNAQPANDDTCSDDYSFRRAFRGSRRSHAWLTIEARL